eukprot:gene12481-biopygen19955
MLVLARFRRVKTTTQDESGNDANQLRSPRPSNACDGMDNERGLTTRDERCCAEGGARCGKMGQRHRSGASEVGFDCFQGGASYTTGQTTGGQISRSFGTVPVPCPAAAPAPAVRRPLFSLVFFLLSRLPVPVPVAVPVPAVPAPFPLFPLPVTCPVVCPVVHDALPSGFWQLFTIVQSSSGVPGHGCAESQVVHKM